MNSSLPAFPATPEQVAPPTALTPQERERAKTAKERGADWAYTINHTIVCFATDALQVPLAAGGAALARANMEKLGKGVNWVARNLGCGHLHFEKDHPFWPQYKVALRDWFKGEVIGDLGAVPVTLGMQYFFPGAMHNISIAAEKLVGPMFKRGAEKDTARWAKEKGIAQDSAEYRAHADALYQNEVKHLGQGVVWTVSSLPLNFLVQLYAGHDHHHGHAHPEPHTHVSAVKKSWKVDPAHFRSKLIEFSGGKLVGTLVTLSMVLGLRTQFPAAVSKWDHWTNDYIFTPANQLAGRAFGMKTAQAPAEEKTAGHPDTKVSEARLAGQAMTQPDPSLAAARA